MDELGRAADELEKAIAELVRRAAELARRSEELNRQLLRLADALARPTSAIPAEGADGPGPAPRGRESARSAAGRSILAEVREFLDGPGALGPAPQ